MNWEEELDEQLIRILKDSSKEDKIWYKDYFKKYIKYKKINYHLYRVINEYKEIKEDFILPSGRKQTLIMHVEVDDNRIISEIL